MNIEETIKRAIKGGFKPTYDSLDSFVLDDPKHWDESLVCRSFLDPFFWQSLGKALRWEDHTKQAEFENRCWKCRWHHFIDHLAEGKTVESFFESL